MCHRAIRRLKVHVIEMIITRATTLLLGRKSRTTINTATLDKPRYSLCWSMMKAVCTLTCHVLQSKYLYTRWENIPRIKLALLLKTTMHILITQRLKIFQGHRNSKVKKMIFFETSLVTANMWSDNQNCMLWPLHIYLWTRRNKIEYTNWTRSSIVMQLISSSSFFPAMVSAYISFSLY